MRMWEKVRTEIVERMLKLRNGAVIEFEDVRGTTKTLTQSHLRALYNAQVAEAVTTTRTLTAADSGSVLFLSAAAGFVTTLPAPALGLNYKFIVKTSPTSNGYVINSASGANIIVILTSEIVTATGLYDDNADTVTFVHNVALKGDCLDLYCDGTNWYGRAQVSADGAITSATT